MERIRPRAKLYGIGDPMSELNIQRRFRCIAEAPRNVGGMFYTPEEIKADPAVAEAVRLLPWVFERKRRV